MAQSRSKKGYSDGYLQQLWRRAVLSHYGEQCIRCNAVPVQCHHYIYRRVRVLRHDYRNGFPLCPECHRLAHTKQGEKWLINFMGKEHESYLLSKERVTLKQYLLEQGISRKEWLNTVALELKAKIAEGNDA